MTTDATLENPIIDAERGRPDEKGDEAAFRFVHSQGFAELLETLGASLVVTTYQAGKLVTFRAREGRVSMLLRSYGQAMGLVVRPDHLAVASEYEIWTLHNSREVAANMKPKGQHATSERSSHVPKFPERSSHVSEFLAHVTEAVVSSSQPPAR